MEKSNSPPIHSLDTNTAFRNPSIQLKTADPDVFYDETIPCIVSGVEPGKYHVAVTITQGMTGYKQSPCGWPNMLIIESAGSVTKKIFDKSEPILVDECGNASFHVKFLPLTRDGLLPQLPVCVSLSSGSAATEFILSSKPCRIISHKMRITQISEATGGSLPKFELSAIDIKREAVNLVGIFDVTLYSISHYATEKTPEMGWGRTQLIWSYENGQSITEMCSLPAVISLKSSSYRSGSSAYCLRASATRLGTNFISLTKIGRADSHVFFYKPLSKAASSSDTSSIPSIPKLITLPTRSLLNATHENLKNSENQVIDHTYVIPKGPRETTHQFVQAVMKALHKAYMTNDPKCISTENLNEAYDMYRNLDMNCILSNLLNPTDPIPIVPAVGVGKDQSRVSLKSYLRNAIPSPKLSTAIPAARLLHSYAEPSRVIGYTQNHTHNEAISRASQPPASGNHQTVNVLSAAHTIQYLQVCSEKCLPPPAQGPINDHTRHSVTRMVSVPSAASAAIDDMQKLENQVAYVNKFYVYHDGVELGHPSHSEDFNLIGFYKEKACGLLVEFIPESLSNRKVKFFFETYCSRLHSGPNDFYQRKKLSIDALKEKLVNGLSHKKVYELP